MSQSKYEVLSDALEANLGMTLRAEKVENQTDLFVETVRTAALQTNSNQLIYGRRGAGKTILLRALRESIEDDRHQRAVAAFYYTATDFRSSPDGADLVGLPARTLAHRFFHAFVQRLVDDVLTLTDELIGPGDGVAAFSAGSAARRARRLEIDRLGIELLQASGYGTDAVDLGAARTTATATTITNKSKSKGASAALGVDTQDAAVSLERKSSAESRMELISRLEPQRQFEPHRVRACIKKIVKLLELEYVVILVDEWMSLGECQVDFAERLKQCLFGEPNIAIKIAADQYQGGLNNSEGGVRFRGLEVGADIFVAADLDEPFRDVEACRSLYAEALYRRLAHNVPRLEQHFGPPDDFNSDYFLDTLFATRNAFETLCYAAQGLCRNFFEIFEFATKEVDLTVTSKRQIAYADVERAIRTNSKEIFKQIQGKLDLSTLFRLIVELLAETKDRFFVIPADTTTHDDLIRELLQMRIIHGVDREILDASIRAQYRVYEVDFGVSLDTGRTAEWATGEKITFARLAAEARAITGANVEKYILDLKGLQRSDFVTCTNPDCERVFSASSGSYAAKSLCPHCYEPVTGAPAPARK